MQEIGDLHGKSVFVVLLIGMSLLSFTPQNVARTAKSTKAQSGSFLSMYENVTTHDGDLIINGTQNFVIENCTFVQNGSIYVRDDAKLSVRRAALMVLSNSNFEHTIEAADFAKVEIESSNITSNLQSRLSLVDQSIGKIINSQFSYGVDCYGKSNASIVNSTLIGPTVGESSQVLIQDSHLFWLTHLDFPSGSFVNIDGLKPGFHEYWSLSQNMTATNISYNLTIIRTLVDSWSLGFESIDSTEAIVSNSIIDKISVVGVYDTMIQFEGIKPQHYENLSIGKIRLVNTTVADHWYLAFYSNSLVAISDSITYIGVGGSCSLSITDSIVLLCPYSYTGVLESDNSTVTISITGVSYSSFYICGNLSVNPPGWEGKWWASSNVTRNFNLLAEDTGGSLMEGVELTLFDRNNTVVWSGQAHSSGKTDFNVTFSDGNYTDTLRLEAVKGNLSATKSISFLSDTPVTMVLGRHDIAMMSVAPAKTVVGQGHNLDTNFTVTNLGDLTETFYATIYANATNIGTYTVFNLVNGTSTTLALACSTTGLAYGNYTISTNTQPVPGENFTANNNYTYSIPVHVGVPGDISGPTSSVYDGTVNMRDISYMIILFNTRPSSPNWNPNADVNGDGTVNMRDISTAILNFNKHE